MRYIRKDSCCVSYWCQKNLLLWPHRNWRVPRKVVMAIEKSKDSSTKSPLLTIIIPNYNRPVLVNNAVRSALAQTLEDIEVLVIDDGSECPAELTPHPKVRHIFAEKNVGGAAIRNIAAFKATGNWICFLDDDDLLCPNFAEDSLRALTSESDLPLPLVVLSGKQTVDTSGKVLFTEYPPTLPKGSHYSLSQLQQGESEFCKQTLVIDRSVFLSLGGFDPEQVCRIHSELFFRLNLQCSVLGVRTVTYTQVQHSGFRVSSDGSIRKQGFDQLITKHLDLFKQHPRKFARFYRQQANVSLQSGYFRDACEEYYQSVRINPAAECSYFLKNAFLPLMKMGLRKLRDVIQPAQTRADGAIDNSGKSNQRLSTSYRVFDDVAYMNRFSKMLGGNYSEQVVFVGSEWGGLYGPGKASTLAFFEKLQYSLHLRGIGVLYIPTPEIFAQELSTQKATKIVCVLVYNEEDNHKHQNRFSILEGLEEREDLLFFNSSKIGRIISDKSGASKLFEKSNIPVPQRLEAGAEPPFFSMPANGTQAGGHVVADVSKIPHGNLTTEYIDTRQIFEGEEYHVSVRVLAIGATLVDAWIRAVPAKYGQVTVHTGDTPLNPELIHYLHNMLVTQKLDALIDLAARLGDSLGPGFYAHDLLYDVKRGQYFVCESEFKFDDPGYRARLFPISAHLPFLQQHFSQQQIDQSADAFVLESQKAGFLLASSAD